MEDEEEFPDYHRSKGWRVMVFWDDGEGGQWFGECRLSGIEPADAAKETEVFNIAVNKAVLSLVKALT